MSGFMDASIYGICIPCSDGCETCDFDKCLKCKDGFIEATVFSDDMKGCIKRW